MSTTVPILAPFAGTISLQASVGDEVVVGQVIAIIEAMKMEVSVTAPRMGRIVQMCVETFSVVTSGDTVCVLEENV